MDDQFRQVSEQAWALWAKSADNGVDFMPLPRHMSDAGQVAQLMWDIWVPESARRLVWESLGSTDSAEVQERAFRLACFLSAVHDVGKASPAFASQVPALIPRMESAGFQFSVLFTAGERRRCPHASVSGMSLVEWAKQKGVGGRGIRTLAAVIAGHHGIYPDASELSFAKPGSRGAGELPWTRVQMELLSAAAKAVGFTDSDLQICARGLNQSAQLILTGFVIVCDWIASNIDLFPLRRLGDADDLAEAALTELGLTLPWIASEPSELGALFRERFNFPDGAEPRPIQTAAAELAESLDRPELIMIEAPTGEGKTEAAMAAAEILGARFGAGGVYFGLPTQATSDAMFGRVLGWLERMGDGQDLSVSLTHGKAQFNREFSDLRKAAFRGIHDDPGEPSGVRAHLWLTRKKAILANFVVGTIDQVLLMALQARHVALRHLGLAGKVVVLDEIHAADEFMFVYLARALEWLAAHRVPVIALSATLPPARRRALIEAYARGRGTADPLAPAEVGARAETAQGFPLITTSSFSVENRSTEPSNQPARTRVEFLDPEIDLSVLLLDLLADGGCAAVVCNTVSRAQTAYAELRAVFGDDVVLLHSRFITADRLRIEGELRAELGPPGRARRPRRRIVVATQVIEQSLDLDFDVMISDLAPIDLVFQRMGRLQRHSRPHEARPTGLRQPQLFLRGVNQVDGSAPDLDRGSVRVYGAAPLLRSLSVLKAHLATEPTLSGVTDVVDLVARAYAPTCLAPPGWEDSWAKAERDAAVQAADREQRAAKFCVSASKPGALFGWMQAMTSDDGDAGHPAVRDIEDGIEAVVVGRGSDGRLRSLPWLDERADEPLDLGTEIEPRLARAVATCTVRLPVHVARGAAGDAIVRDLEADGLETWQRSSWLRGMLPLALDDDLTRAVQGWVFRYDRCLGLLVERKGAEADG